MAERSEQALLAKKNLGEIIRTNRLSASYYEKLGKDYDELDQLLSGLPTKLTHEIMVPLNSVAFMMGHLEHTNEVTVYLGDGYFTKTTAKQAQAVLSRRRTFAKDALAKFEEQYAQLKSKIGLVSELLDVEEGSSKAVEIREKLDEPFDLVLPSGARMEAVGEDQQSSRRREDENRKQAPTIEVLSQEDVIEEVDTSAPDGDRQDDYNEKILQVLMEMEKSGIEAPNADIRKVLGDVQEGKPAVTQQQSKEATKAVDRGHRDVVETLGPTGHDPEEEPPRRVSKFKAARVAKNST